MNKKIKTGIITFHFVNNYGGVLQAYALSHILSLQLNTDTEVIDYRNRFIRFTDFVRLFPITSKPEEIISGLKTMGLRFRRIHKFKRFISKDLNLSRRYNSVASLRNDQPDCDVFICGSDQIWNPVITLGVSEVYFLGFTDKTKISYAPSFGTGSGVSRLKPKYEKKIKKYLHSFHRISVREKEGVDLINRLSGQSPLQLIDPVFLPEKQVWLAMSRKPAVKGQYILVYIMQQDNEIFEYIHRLKMQTGLKVVAISRYGYQPEYIDECLVDVGPEEFVGLFSQAEYICTNSFHGLAFSIIFDKKCFFVACKKFASRIDNLAKLLQIDLNIADSISEPSLIQYDQETVHSIINREREKSINYFSEGFEAIRIQNQIESRFDD